MLTKQECAGIKAVIALIDDDDIFSLAKILTKGNIQLQDRKECERAIVNFSETGRDFLHRRACSKAVLVQYAYQEHLSVLPNSTREDVIRLILEKWNGEPVTRDVNVAGENNGKEHGVSQKTVNIVNYNINYAINHNHSASSSSASLDNSAELDHVFAEQFTHWFFDGLNHRDPVSQGFGPSSFLPEAVLKMSHFLPGNENKKVIQGSSDVAKCFLNVFENYKLQPNYSGGGLQVKSDPHGLKMILVCGTLSKVSSLRGVFEQSFGLVQDSECANHWRILNSELRLREGPLPNAPPQLADFCDIPEIEANTIQSLQVALRK